ncbi:hypothetical protein P3549_23870, partial [Vibrio parahaemolyticus]|nr:hypothetical protein [Vibrio parahaemolyticus]
EKLTRGIEFSNKNQVFSACLNVTQIKKGTKEPPKVQMNFLFRQHSPVRNSQIEEALRRNY